MAEHRPAMIGVRQQTRLGFIAHCCGVHVVVGCDGHERKPDLALLKVELGCMHG